MTKADDRVVRRFEVEVAQGGALAADVKRALEARDPKLRRPEIKLVGNRRLLEVRLEGSAESVSTVMAELTAMNGVRIQHDRVRRPLKQAPVILPPAPGPTRAVVAIVDSGIMVKHPILKNCLWRGSLDGVDYEFGARCIRGKPKADVTDEDGHGTRLAGTILAAADGAEGVQLMTVKFFDPDNLPGPDNGAAAIDFATRAERRADIINLSWDLGMGSPKLQRAIIQACEAGALVVIAAGNSGADNDCMPAIPAHYRKLYKDQIITVMATDRYNEKASFSNYGVETVDVAAPGVDIPTTRASLSRSRERELAQDFRGTSAAAALVSGMAARLKSNEPNLTAVELKERLCAAATRIPGLKCIDGKFLDPLNLPALSPASPPGGGGQRSGHGAGLGAGSLR